MKRVYHDIGYREALKRERRIDAFFATLVLTAWAVAMYFIIAGV